MNNEFSSPEIEDKELHNTNALFAQEGIKCKYNRPMIRLNKIKYQENEIKWITAKIGHITIGEIMLRSGFWYIYPSTIQEYGTDPYNTLEEAKKALENWFISQIGEMENG